MIVFSITIKKEKEIESVCNLPNTWTFMSVPLSSTELLPLSLKKTTAPDLRNPFGT